MDPLCHSLVGLSLSRAGLARRTPLAATALVVGANLPDVDAVAYFLDGDLSLLVRRGWTHGLPAVAAWPLLLTGLLLAADRWRCRRGDRPRARPRALLGVAALGVASHPALDWLNTYGMRWLMPFDGRWFYGDALYIVDPWLWLLLGAALFLSRPPRLASTLAWGALAVLATYFLWTTGRPVPQAARLVWTGLLLATGLAGILVRRHPALSGPRAERRVRTALVLALVYVAAMLGLGRWGRSVAASQLARRLPGSEVVLVAPLPGQPLTWDVLARTPEVYRWGRLRLGPRPELRLTDGQLSRIEGSELAQAALAQPQVRGLRAWGRFLWFQAEPSSDGWRVFLADARYVRRQGSAPGFAAAVVPLAGGNQ